jgi:hypothetical protein
MKISSLLVALSSLMLAGAAYADSNLVVNGDFSAGNTGFTSGYTYYSPMNWQPTRYSVGTLSSFGDHTTGSGKFLMADGAYSATTAVWSQTINVAANTDYSFEAWAREVYTPSSPVVTLGFYANSTQIGTLALAHNSTASWQQFLTTWNSGTLTTVNLQIRDLQTNNGVPGNDFAIDDIRLSAVAPVPEPETYALMMAGLGLLGFMAKRKKSV